MSKTMSDRQSEGISSRRSQFMSLKILKLSMNVKYTVWLADTMKDICRIACF